MFDGKRPRISESPGQVHSIFHRDIKERAVPPSWLPEIALPTGLDLLDECTGQAIDVR